MIIRSDKDNLDLVGLDSSSKQMIERSSDSFALPERHMVTIPTTAIQGELREGSIAFAWHGAARKDDVKKIERLLFDLRVDLVNAISSPDEGRLEWLISKVILLCEEADERTRGSRRAVIVSLVTVIIIFILTLATWAFFKIVGANH